MPEQLQSSAPQSASPSDGSSNAIAQAVVAGVQTAMGQIASQLAQLQQSITESVKKQSVEDDRSFSTDLFGAYDVAENMRRADVARDRIAVQAELALANAVELAKQVGMRACDHFSSLPPVGVAPVGSKA